MRQRERKEGKVRSFSGDEGTVDMATPRPTTRIPAPASPPERRARCSATATTRPDLLPTAGEGAAPEPHSEESDLMPCTHVCIAGDTEKNEGDGMSAKKGEKERDRKRIGVAGRSVALL